jgi:hypothetical protein
MNRTMCAIALTSCIGLAGSVAAGTAAPQTATGDTAATNQVAYSTATAIVLHSVTRQPLGGMPVFVIEVLTPEAIDPVRVFTTGPDGTVLISPLRTGVYSAFVFHNNNYSNVVTFEINADTDYHPIITLFFNPDIDR